MFKPYVLIRNELNKTTERYVKDDKEVYSEMKCLLSEMRCNAFQFGD
jgi:hypothetical protein